MLPGGSADAAQALVAAEQERSTDLEPAMSVEEVTEEEAAAPAPSPAAQAQEVEAAEARPIAEGDHMYLISLGCVGFVCVCVDGCVCGWLCLWWWRLGCVGTRLAPALACTCTQSSTG
jgi:hypothetical protein